MKKPKKSVYLLLALVLLTAAVAAIHLSTRVTVPEKTLLVEFQGKSTIVDISALPLQDVQGSLVNGKGETREISAKGCLLSAILEEALDHPENAVKVTITAADEFSAEVSAEEWSLPDRVYLLLEENELQLVVFGDSNSKRNVKNVERLLVE